MREVSTAKSERLELLQSAHQRGLFSDFRTFAFLDALLEDRCAELITYAECMVIPSAGQTMIPIPRDRLKFDDRSANVRSLHALILLHDPELPSIIDIVFSESLPAMQVTAIPYLATRPGNKEFLSKLAGDRKKMCAKPPGSRWPRWNEETLSRQ